MTRQDYQKAMDCFEPDMDMKRRAAARIEREGRYGRTGGRALAVVLAAAVVLVCTMGIALAASPELRQAVLTFFRLEEVEQVPNASQLPDVSQAVIGGQVSAQYLRLEGDGWQNRDGLLYRIVGNQALNDSYVPDAYYTVGEHGLEKLDTRTTRVTAVWDGETFDLSFIWARLEDRVVVCDGTGTSRSGTHSWNVGAIPGRTDVAAVLLFQPENQEKNIEQNVRMFVCRLDSGTVENVMAACPLDQLGSISQITLAPDLKHAIAWKGSAYDQPYLCGLETGTMEPLADLMGVTVTEHTRVYFTDEGTILATLWDSDGTVNTWVYDIRQGGTTQTVRDRKLTLYWGAYGMASRGWLYGTEITLEGATAVVDLRTGVATPIEGFRCDKNGEFAINADGNKLLYTVNDWSAVDTDILQMGVLDLEKGTFTAFDRQGYETVQELSAGWLDESHAAVWVGDWSGGNADGYWLYVYEF